MHLLLPILAIEIVVISANGLYACGKARRHYGRLFSAMTFACLLLLLIAFLYDPNQYASRSTFLLFWFLSYFLLLLVGLVLMLLSMELGIMVLFGILPF